MFLKGNQYGSKTKRGRNKIDKDLREQLKNITKEVLDSIDVKELTRTQRISFLKTSLGYLLPKEIITDTHIQEDLPLFISDDKPVVIAFNNAEERAEYNEADAEKKKLMEKKLAVNMFGNNGEA